MVSTVRVKVARLIYGTGHFVHMYIMRFIILIWLLPKMNVPREAESAYSLIILHLKLKVFRKTQWRIGSFTPKSSEVFTVQRSNQSVQHILPFIILADHGNKENRLSDNNFVMNDGSKTSILALVRPYDGNTATSSPSKCELLIYALIFKQKKHSIDDVRTYFNKGSQIYLASPLNQVFPQYLTKVDSKIMMNIIVLASFLFPYSFSTYSTAFQFIPSNTIN